MITNSSSKGGDAPCLSQKARFTATRRARRSTEIERHRSDRQQSGMTLDACPGHGDPEQEVRGRRIGLFGCRIPSDVARPNNVSRTLASVSMTCPVHPQTLLAEDRVEGRSDRERQALIVGEKAPARARPRRKSPRGATPNGRSSPAIPKVAAPPRSISGCGTQAAPSRCAPRPSTEPFR